jgi:hypothetical protein
MSQGKNRPKAPPPRAETSGKEAEVVRRLRKEQEELRRLREKNVADDPVRAEILQARHTLVAPDTTGLAADSWIEALDMEAEARARRAKVELPDKTVAARLNESAQKFWTEKTPIMDERIDKYPEDVDFAVKRYRRDVLKGIEPKKIDSLEEHIVDLAERDQRRNTRYSRMNRRSKGDDALDTLISEGINKRMSANAMWQWIVRRSDTVAELDVKDDAIIVQNEAGEVERRITKKSFPSVVSQLKRKISTK